MIVREYYMTRKDGVRLFRTYSDAGKEVRKVGTEDVYDEAIDVESASCTYEETDSTIDSETE